MQRCHLVLAAVVFLAGRPVNSQSKYNSRAAVRAYGTETGGDCFEDVDNKGTLALIASARSSHQEELTGILYRTARGVMKNEDTLNMLINNLAQIIRPATDRKFCRMNMCSGDEHDITRDSEEEAEIDYRKTPKPDDDDPVPIIEPENPAFGSGDDNPVLVIVDDRKNPVKNNKGFMQSEELLESIHQSKDDNPILISIDDEKNPTLSVLDEIHEKDNHVPILEQEEPEPGVGSEDENPVLVIVDDKKNPELGAIDKIYGSDNRVPISEHKEPGVRSEDENPVLIIVDDDENPKEAVIEDEEYIDLWQIVNNKKPMDGLKYNNLKINVHGDKNPGQAINADKKYLNSESKLLIGTKDRNPVAVIVHENERPEQVEDEEHLDLLSVFGHEKHLLSKSTEEDNSLLVLVNDDEKPSQGGFKAKWNTKKHQGVIGIKPTSKKAVDISGQNTKKLIVQTKDENPDREWYNLHDQDTGEGSLFMRNQDSQYQSNQIVGDLGQIVVPAAMPKRYPGVSGRPKRYPVIKSIKKRYPVVRGRGTKYLVRPIDHNAAELRRYHGSPANHPTTIEGQNIHGGQGYGYSQGEHGLAYGENRYPLTGDGHQLFGDVLQAMPSKRVEQVLSAADRNINKTAKLQGYGKAHEILKLNTQEVFPAPVDNFPKLYKRIRPEKPGQFSLIRVKDNPDGSRLQGADRNQEGRWFQNAENSVLREKRKPAGKDRKRKAIKQWPIPVRIRPLKS